MNTHLDERPSKNLRENILELEHVLSKIPGAVFGDSELMPLNHSFAEGIYVREIFIPKGTILTGKIHRHSHPNFLMKGEVIVVTEHGGREYLKAPLSMISKAGTKRAVFALEDTVWITVHATGETDLEKIEEYVIAKSYSDLLPPGENAMVESELAMKNCLIRALKEKGRDYQCLLELKAEGILLPLKEAIDQLKQKHISMEGLFASRQTDGIWHVNFETGTPLEELLPSDSDMVGAWAVVAVGGAALIGGAVGYMSTQGGNAQTPGADPNLNALENEQLSLLREQREQQRMFQPLQAEQAGYQLVQTPVQAWSDAAKAKYFKANPGAEAQGVADYNAAYPQGTNFGIKDEGALARYNDLWKKINAQTDDTYSKTTKRTAQDKQIEDLQGAQMATAQRANDALNKYLESMETDDYKAYQKAQQELQAQQTQIALQQGERTKKALAGELPVSQGTIDRKAQDFQLLKENLARSGNAIIGDDPGSAYSLSSPGVQALKQFNQQYGTIEAQERQGQLDTGTQGYLQAVGMSGDIGQNALNTTGQLSNVGGYAGTSSSLNPGASPVQNNAGLIQGYSAAMTPYLQQQQLQNSNNQLNAEMQNANKAGWLQLAGMGGGMVAGAYGGKK